MSPVPLWVPATPDLRCSLTRDRPLAGVALCPPFSSVIGMECVFTEQLSGVSVAPLGIIYNSAVLCQIHPEDSRRAVCHNTLM